MSVHTLQRLQRIPAPLNDVWNFFSNPANLPLITPPDMNFTIISAPTNDPIYPGQIIEYTLQPVLHISVYWMTEITQVHKGVFFVDEQRKGPYRLWHHQHHFKEIANGTEMTDLVHYRLPVGFIGDWAHTLFVRKRLEDIFQFRQQYVEKLYGKFE